MKIQPDIYPEAPAHGIVETPFDRPIRRYLTVRVDRSLYLRSVRDNDVSFLQRLYRDSRNQELEMASMPESLRQAFCDSQLRLQHKHWIAVNPLACFYVVWFGLKPIGRLYFNQTSKPYHLIDITLLTSHQRQGIGGRLLTWLQQKARRDEAALTLNVTHENLAAKALYIRLGFSPGEMNASRQILTWADPDSV